MVACCQGGGSSTEPGSRAHTLNHIKGQQESGRRRETGREPRVPVLQLSSTERAQDTGMGQGGDAVAAGRDHRWVQ